MGEHVHCIVTLCKQVITDSQPQDGRESSCTRNQLVEGVRLVCTVKISQQLTCRCSSGLEGAEGKKYE